MEKKMKRFYVIDEENATSWSHKTDAGEYFTTEANAHERAKILAESEPGKKFYVAVVTHLAVCEVQSAKIQVA